MTPLYLISQSSQLLALNVIPILVSLLSLIVALGSFRIATKNGQTRSSLANDC
jgi:hypothetical protein